MCNPYTRRKLVIFTRFSSFFATVCNNCVYQRVEPAEYLVVGFGWCEVYDNLYKGHQSQDDFSPVGLDKFSHD